MVSTSSVTAARVRLTRTESLTVLAMGLGFSITGADPTILSSNITAVQHGLGLTTSTAGFVASWRP